MTALISYHNDPKIKDDILEQLKRHYDADEIIKGQYWHEGKGCAVGCTLHGSSHKEYESRFGIPAVLAHLEDRIFEGIPNALAKEWPIKFMASTPVGKDLSKIWHKFAIWLIVDEEFGVVNFSKDELAKDFVIAVADLHQQSLFRQVEHGEWVSLRDSVYAPYGNAVYSCACYSLCYDSECSAASAYAAAYAMMAATYTYDAGYSGRVEGYFVAQSEKLLQLLRECDDE